LVDLGRASGTLESKEEEGKTERCGAAMNLNAWRHDRLSKRSEPLDA
jgi:hypothetical protein